MSEPEQPSTRGGVLGTLAIAGVILAAVFVFVLLPRISAPPVVTKDVARARTSSPPVSTPSVQEATPPPTPDREPEEPIPLDDPPPARERPQAPEPGADVWSAAVSDGLSAFERGSLAEAREAFARAESARPGTSAVRDGLARVADAQKDASLAEHRARALRAEAAEDWSAARNEYEAAQKLDPAVAFAVEGRPRATDRQALDERLEGYLKRPERLTTDAVAREAEIVLDRAAEVGQPGARLRRQIAALRESLAAARTVVAVRLVSDGVTEVTMLRVGALGAFKEKTLQLRPGRYVVVGTRKGYRDARVTLELAAGRAVEPVRVRCEEAL